MVTFFNKQVIFQKLSLRLSFNFVPAFNRDACQPFDQYGLKGSSQSLIAVLY